MRKVGNKFEAMSTHALGNAAAACFEYIEKANQRIKQYPETLDDEYAVIVRIKDDLRQMGLAIDKREDLAIAAEILQPWILSPQRSPFFNEEKE